ncbi:MAG: tyrosine-type recombinase/integrase [Candidatus Tectomicrobia bacterium]|nr:tyrosine-type recombinase/integrase [Candidatus Tectomicrobia bacterium]
MAGVTGRKYADGTWRIWYMDGTGKQKFARGTRSKRESRQLAKELETRERYWDAQAAPTTQDVHRGDPFDGIVSDYLAWGATQGGLNGGPWSAVHAAQKRVRLGYWKENLGLEFVADLRGKLPAAEACLRELKEGRTNKTLNGYIDALKSLSTWCVDRDYLEDNPFRKLRFLDARPQVERRALTTEEAARLLAAAPSDRRILYETALLSGLRANECRHLTLRHLDRKNGGIWLEAEWSKGRRDCLQPLPGWFLDRLHDYGSENIASTLYEKHRGDRRHVPAEPLFYVPHHTARSIGIDLKAAGIDKSTPEGKIDFHALRTTFSTLLDDVGATEKTKEVLLRHAPATLAHKRYVKVRSWRPNEAVEQVAGILGLAQFYAKSYAKTMPKPEKLAVGQDYNPLKYQGVRCGKEGVVAEGTKPGAACADSPVYSGSVRYPSRGTATRTERPWACLRRWIVNRCAKTSQYNIHSEASSV